MVEIFLIAVSLALDAFAVSVSSGISIPGFGVKQAARMGLWFGAFQFMMPVAGWLLGSSVSQYIETVDHWVAFVLSLVGGLVGKRLGGLFQRRAELVGGLVLIAIGVKILIEHLSGG